MSPDSPPVKKNKKREASKDKDKDKDPNAPKKPANAFFMYCQQQRTVMQDDQKDPNIGHHELTKSLAKEWNNLATDDKKVHGFVYAMRGSFKDSVWSYSFNTFSLCLIYGSQLFDAVESPVSGLPQDQKKNPPRGGACVWQSEM